MARLHAGRIVIAGIRNCDLFIFSHPEFKAGIKERLDAILLSVPDGTAPEARVAAERFTMHAGIYPREIEHLKVTYKRSL